MLSSHPASQEEAIGGPVLDKCVAAKSQESYKTEVRANLKIDEYISGANQLNAYCNQDSLLHLQYVERLSTDGHLES